MNISANSATRTELEIGHVLFMDVVGYSKLLTNEQREIQRVLNEIVRGTERFRLAEAAGKLIRLPVGDGMALVFFNSPEAPVQCALEICQALKAHSQLQLRMGIHSGPVTGLTDVNDRSNVAGAGINMAQRVMDCGDARHILLSQRLADDLGQHAEWIPHLHDLGEVEVKHGIRVAISNLYSETFGNSDKPEKIRRAEQEYALSKRRRIVLTVTVLLILALCLGIGTWVWQRRAALTSAYKAGSAGLSGKSIAVLPLTNMSDEKENAWFSDGVHEDIITSLGRIAELRVISNTSVMQYRDTKKSLRQIAEELHVAYVLEGSVRRAGNAVRVTGQLIEASTDRQIWAKSYDRELTDIFAIQAALASEIADSLRVAITPAEKSALATTPTTVPAAYDLYLHARASLNDPTFNESDKPLRTAEALLRSAVDLDPAFSVAWAQLADVHAQFVFNDIDLSPGRLTLAKSAMEKAIKLAPDNPDVVRNLGAYYYHQRDYARAEEQYRRVLRQQPNDAYAHSFLALLLRRQAKWIEALSEWGRAAELEPGNLYLQRSDIAYRFLAARRYAEIEARLPALAAVENDPLGEFALDIRQLPFMARGSTKELEDYLNGLPAEIKRTSKYTAALHELAAFKGDWSELARLHRLTADPEHCVETATTLAALGRIAEARETLQAKPDELHARLKLEGRNTTLWDRLARVEAVLGHRTEALEALDRRRALLPAGDVLDQITHRQAVAFVNIWTGDKDGALAELAWLVRQPFSEPVNIMRTSPDYAPLHSDPRFQTMVNDPANRLPLF
ncbi:MAG: tetratricopeptide repeat protein [Chthoniobacterales bacterium]